MGQGKRRASDGLLSLGSHSSSAYANPNSTTTTIVGGRASLSSSEGSRASLGYRSQRTGSGTTRADRYSSNNEGMRRDADREEIERLERALEGYGSGSSDDEGGGVGRRGAGKGGELGRGGRHGGGGEEGDSDSSLNLHTPLPWASFFFLFPSSHPSRRN
jgi:hypothetical protein